MTHDEKYRDRIDCAVKKGDRKREIQTLLLREKELESEAYGRELAKDGMAAMSKDDMRKLADRLEMEIRKIAKSHEISCKVRHILFPDFDSVGRKVLSLHREKWDLYFRCTVKSESIIPKNADYEIRLAVARLTGLISTSPSFDNEIEWHAKFAYCEDDPVYEQFKIRFKVNEEWSGNWDNVIAGGSDEEMEKCRKRVEEGIEKGNDWRNRHELEKTRRKSKQKRFESWIRAKDLEFAEVKYVIDRMKSLKGALELFMKKKGIKFGSVKMDDGSNESFLAHHDNFQLGDSISFNVFVFPPSAVEKDENGEVMEVHVVPFPERQEYDLRMFMAKITGAVSESAMGDDFIQWNFSYRRSAWDQVGPRAIIPVEWTRDWNAVMNEMVSHSRYAEVEFDDGICLSGNQGAWSRFKNMIGIGNAENTCQ